MRILMVSTEYPPMLGGVGRYAANLTNALRRQAAEVFVVCNEKGDGDYNNVGLSPTNIYNSELLLRIVYETKPDIVHVQFEPGLYGLVMDLTNPKNSRTYIDSFYRTCNIPIVTTFHSAYGFKDWMAQAFAVKAGRYGKLGIPARIGVKAWRNFINFKAFKGINHEKLRLSHAAICFSKYLSKSIGGGHVIYHGAEPAIYPTPSKEEARRRLSLPIDKMLAVAVGFKTITKGWDILEKIEMPKDWMLVLNSSKGHYNREDFNLSFAARENIIDLQRGFLSEGELSLLLCASDCVVLPYRIASGSGVMFDALGHGLPFVASNLASFKEFADLGLGLIVKRRSPNAFSDAIEMLGQDYDSYFTRVNKFRKDITWRHVARQHIDLYSDAISERNKRMDIHQNHLD